MHTKKLTIENFKVEVDVKKIILRLYKFDDYRYIGFIINKFSSNIVLNDNPVHICYG